MITITLSNHTNRYRRDSKPTMGDIANGIGMDEDSIRNICNNKISNLSLDTANKIIAFMRQNHNANFGLTDLIKYTPD